MATPREENARKAARRRFEARELLNGIKKRRPCKDCGKRWHPCQMDFYRGDGGPRQAVSRRLLKSKAAILEDVKKCVLLCANCARMRNWTAQRIRRSGPT